MHVAYNYLVCASLFLPFPISLVMVVIMLKCSIERKKDKRLVLFSYYQSTGLLWEVGTGWRNLCDIVTKNEDTWN